jgi:hypothetical protein
MIMVITATQSIRHMVKREERKSKNSTTKTRKKLMIRRHQVKKVARMEEVMKRRQTRKTNAHLEKARETNLPTKSRPRRTSGRLAMRV